MRKTKTTKQWSLLIHRLLVHQLIQAIKQKHSNEVKLWNFVTWLTQSPNKLLFLREFFFQNIKTKQFYNTKQDTKYKQSKTKEWGQTNKTNQKLLSLQCATNAKGQQEHSKSIPFRSTSTVFKHNFTRVKQNPLEGSPTRLFNFQLTSLNSECASYLFLIDKLEFGFG